MTATNRRETERDVAVAACSTRAPTGSRPFGNSRRFQPGAPRTHRTRRRVAAIRKASNLTFGFLVDLGAPDPHDQTVAVLGHVLDVSSHQLEHRNVPAKSPVSYVTKARAERRNQAKRSPSCGRFVPDPGTAETIPGL